MDKIMKLVQTAVEIEQTKPTAEEIIFQPRQLILTTLPHRDPKTDLWVKHNRNISLVIQSAYDAEKDKHVGLPYGSLPRLLIIWLTKEAIKTQSRHIKIGNSMHDFMKTLDIETDGRAGRRLKNQSERLFRATISITERTSEYVEWNDFKIARRGKLWFSDPDPKILDLFKSEIELSHDYYDMITNAPVPLDLRAIKALKHSPLALDLYSWLSYRSFTLREAKKPLFVPLDALNRQLGADYKNQKDFNEKIRRQLLAVRAVSRVEFDVVRAVKGRTKAGITIQNRSKVNIQPILS